MAQYDKAIETLPNDMTYFCVLVFEVWIPSRKVCWQWPTVLRLHVPNFDARCSRHPGQAKASYFAQHCLCALRRYYNNKAAVYLEQGKFEECEKLLKDILDRKYEMNSAFPGGASFEKVAKVLNRLAACYAKQHRYQDALDCYQKSLAEDNSRVTRNAMRELEKTKEKHEREAYIDPAKAEEHKEKGIGTQRSLTSHRSSGLVSRGPTTCRASRRIWDFEIGQSLPKRHQIPIRRSRIESSQWKSTCDSLD